MLYVLAHSTLGERYSAANVGNQSFLPCILSNPIFYFSQFFSKEIRNEKATANGIWQMANGKWQMANGTDQFKPRVGLVKLQPTLRGVYSPAARPVLGRTTRNVWLRCLEYTREFHKLQRVVGLVWSGHRGIYAVSCAQLVQLKTP